MPEEMGDAWEKWSLMDLRDGRQGESWETRTPRGGELGARASFWSSLKGCVNTLADFLTVDQVEGSMPASNAQAEQCSG